jgi:hypothetical protein
MLVVRPAHAEAPVPVVVVEEAPPVPVVEASPPVPVVEAVPPVPVDAVVLLSEQALARRIPRTLTA